MANFSTGLALVVLGFLAWVVASIMAGATEATTGTADTGWLVVMYLGFGTMTLGPLLFWIIIPFIGWLDRKDRESQ